MKGTGIKSIRPKHLPPFLFQKYLNPIWYFNLVPIEGDTVSTAHYSGIPDVFSHKLSKDTTYSTEAAALSDLGIQAWNKGILSLTNRSQLDAGSRSVPDRIYDNYVYTRKYYKPTWAWYVFLCRLFAFHNPV